MSDETRYDNGNTAIYGSEITSFADATLYDAIAQESVGDVVIEQGAALLGIYQVESEAIEGGMGKVWRVRHTGWNTDLAMKQPKAELFQSERQKISFVIECEAWISLGLHPHIVSCHYVREIGGIPSIFAEWMNGGSLKSRIHSGKLYEGDEHRALARVLDVAIQFERGLHYAHENGLIHQDVKPDNLLLTETGEAKVADFGIANARALLTAGSASALIDGTIISNSGAYTLAYCSPEQLNGEVLTRRTDIYSWAVSVLEMFLGERLWESGIVAGAALDDYLGMDMKVVMPMNMQSLLRRCLGESPVSRPHDFAEIDAELLQIYQSVTGGVYPRTLPKAAADTADSFNNRALSYLDLGKPKDAEMCWERALEITPGHSEALFNQSVYLWEHGVIDDIEVMRRLKANKPENIEYYLAQIHFARGDAHNAKSHLRKVKGTFGTFDDTDESEEMQYQVQKTQTDIKTQEISYKILSAFALAPRMLEEDINGKCLGVLQLGIRKTEEFYLCPDGKTAVSLTVDKEIEYWDISTATCARTVQTKERTMFAAFSPDGHMLLTRDTYIACPAIRQWSIATGECVKTFEEQEKNFTPKAFRFSPDGKTLLCGDYNTLKGFDVITGKCTFTHTGKKFRMRAISFSPDGKTALSGNKDKTVSLWNLKTGRCIRKFKDKHEKDILHICFSPDGKTAYSTDGGLNMIYWDIATGQVIRRNRGTGDSVHFSPDGKTAISTGEAARLWNVSTGQCIRTFICASYGYRAESASFSGDGSMVAIFFSSNDNIQNDLVKLYALPKLRSCEAMLSDTSKTTQTLEDKALFDIIADETKRLIKNGDISAALEQITRLAEIRRFGTSAEYYAIRAEAAHYCVRGGLIDYRIRFVHAHCDSTIISRTGEKALLLDWDKPSVLININTGERISTLMGHKAGVCSAAFSADEKMVLLGYINGTAWLWDVITGQHIRSFGEESISGSVRTVCFSPDGKMALSDYSNGDMSLWDIQTGECIRVFGGHSSNINSACFSADGKKILSSSIFSIYDDYNTLKLWDVATGKCIQSYKGGLYTINSVCFSPDGKKALFDNHKTMLLWDIDSWRPIYEFETLSNLIISVCISPDGRKAVSLDRDALKLWDIASKRCICEFKGFENRIRTIALNPDGSKLSAGGDKGIVVYDLDYELTFPGWRNWDDGALPYLQAFLALHSKYNESDFQNLITELQNHGYGWLRPEGVRIKLKELRGF